MRSPLSLLCAILVTIPTAAHAQSSAVGTWKGEILGAGAPRAVILVVNGDGTGTFNAGNDNQLSGIAIEGDSISFTFKPVGAGGAVTMSMAGTVAGDTMTLRGTIGEGPPGPPMTLMRQQ
jgi:hypothetical protein